MTEEPATPRQVAYLRFMGYPASPSMGGDKASHTIAHLYELLGSDELRDNFSDRQSQWRRDRFILHKDLYGDYELQQFLGEELGEILHDHVRKRIVGASQRLTKSKIREVINSLTAINREWWREANYQQTFFECLKRLHPGCCDGRTPDRKPTPSAPSQSIVFANPVLQKKRVSESGNRTSMSLSTIVILIIVAILVFAKIFGGR